MSIFRNIPSGVNEEKISLVELILLSIVQSMLRMQ